MDGIVSSAKTLIEQGGDIFTDIGSATQPLTDKAKRNQLITGMAGLYGAAIVGGIITFVPFSAFGGVGDTIRTIATALIALSMFNVGVNKNSMAWKMGGVVMTAASASNLLGAVGIRGGLSNRLHKAAASG